jgi:hypothetical protein
MSRTKRRRSVVALPVTPGAPRNQCRAGHLIYLKALHEP